MSVATHVIKIKGEFDESNWNEEKLKELVKAKFKEISEFWCPDLELFKIDGNKIDVWVFIESFNSEIESLADKWLKYHILEKEGGITIKNVEAKEVPYKDGIRVTLNNFALENL